MKAKISAFYIENYEWERFQGDIVRAKGDKRLFFYNDAKGLVEYIDRYMRKILNEMRVGFGEDEAIAKSLLGLGELYKKDGFAVWIIHLLRIYRN